MNETLKLTIRPLEEKKHRRLFNALEMQEYQKLEMIFEETKGKEAYFDRYEGIQSETSQAIKFDESTDLSTTYLGRVGQTRKSVIRAEESFPISGRGYAIGKLLDKTDCNILVDTVQASRICLNHSTCKVGYFTHYLNLHQLPKESK